MMRIKAVVCGAGIGAAMALAPGAALAAPTEVTGGGGKGFSYTLTAASGTANNLNVSLGTRTLPDGSVIPAYVFSDPAGLTTPLFSSCEGGQVVDPFTGRQAGPTLTCTAPPPEEIDGTSLKFDMGDGNDTLTIAQGASQPDPRVEQQIKGGAGNDTLTGSAQFGAFFTFIQGGPGNDRLSTSGAHSLSGEGGIDKLFAKNGVRNTRINCGPGKNAKESAKRDKKDAKAVSC
jgi:hypothetical protein